MDFDGAQKVYSDDICYELYIIRGNGNKKVDT